ncbi:fungal-specific transcription factor domain-containing protein [Sporodiniella umbellata]|nr:fungal-specific transcription factor domain-containing protein [Sporodiniella umbellata]
MSNFHIRYLNKGQGDCMLFNSIVSEETILEYSLEDHVPKSIISNLINIYFSSDLLLPIVDREDFLDSYEGRGPSPPSTLLICAICAYACLLVKPCDPLFARESTTYEVVYKSISKLASTFFQTPSFTPSIESIQALCLFANHPPFLSFCCSSFLSSSDTIWIFTGLAVRLAQDLGLHRTVDSTNNSDSNMKRKRLWYCVYVTDRWHCLISEKPLAISDFDCDVDMKLAEKSNSDPNLDIFVSFIKLTKILGNILRLVHSARAKATEYRGEGIKKIIESLQNSLNVWYAETSPDLKKIEELDLQKSLVSYQDFYEHSKRLAKGGPLIICYHLAHISLYRPFMSLEESDVPFVSHCVKKCIEAAKQVIQLSQCISTDRMIKFGWNYSYYPVFFASLVHVTVSTSNHPDLAREATELYNVAVNKTLAPVLRNVPNGEVLVHLLQNLLGLLKRKQHIENSEYSEKHQSCFDATKQMMFAESPLSYSFGESFFLQDLIPPDLSAIYFNQNYQSI